MTITLGRLLGDAFAIARREADIVLRVAGVLLFLPAFALQLLVPGPPPLPAARDQAALSGWIDAVGLWAQSNAIWYIVVDAIGLLGVATIILLLVDPGRPDVRGALARGLRLLPRWALASVLAGIPVGLGLWLFILPGLYMQARLVAAGPVLFAEQPVSATGALGRSWRMTGKGAFGLFSAVTTLMLASWLVTNPLYVADTYLRAPEHANPFIIALVDALIAAAQAAYEVALALVAIVAWRRLSRQGI
ncbi:conserved membrane hypothetical protein [Sphingomonas sp. EC-HK361]|jgi:hypothetical protein|uniref:hypothetical protein n=1 Tax=Sphingomonas sp. EC-HK361 TaxID=2038397 RepID=UPI001257FEFB|nr:hypothetical protein [Sphingomonas sp. EC-HK361]VVT16655.1 conserved membrane hypothetical protein [Sphingomonas sp. EC-HK361]